MGESVICPYCQRAAELVRGDWVYPHRPDLYDKKFYACKPCAAFISNIFP